MAVQIPLTQGYVALVDDEDAASVLQQKWCAYVGNGHVWASSRKMAMHRFLLKAPRGFVVDHINGDSLDNRRANLRLCRHAENMRNRKIRSDSTNVYKGIRKMGRGFAARVRLDGKEHYLGTFDTAELAARAYDEAASRVYGEFARLNFPNENGPVDCRPGAATELSLSAAASVLHPASSAATQHMEPDR